MCLYWIPLLIATVVFLEIAAVGAQTPPIPTVTQDELASHLTTYVAPTYPATAQSFVPVVAVLALSVFAQGPGTSKADKGSSNNKGPIPYTTKSIARGQQFYLIHCVECHDQDGKGLGRRDFNGTQPADLTDPDAWMHGISTEAVFSSIREGTKDDMPPFKGRLQEEQIWHVVNFVRSLWPEARRPKLETVADRK